MTGASPQRIVVIGGGGDVGRGVVRAALRRGWEVTAVGRRPESLRDLEDESSGMSLDVRIGSVASQSEADVLADALDLQGPVAVVNAISLRWTGGPLLGTGFAPVADYLGAYLGGHHAAARSFLPRMGEGSVYLGIGGGRADFVVPGTVPVSMAQAAERMFYRGLHREARNLPVHVRELMVVSKVAGDSNRDSAQPEWLTDAVIGERVCDIVSSPDGEENRGPILTIAPPPA